MTKPSRKRTLWYGPRMGRGRWKPKTDEQREALAALVARFRKIDEDEAAGWQEAAEVAALGVPKTHIAEQIKRGRTTLYGHLPDPPATPEDEATT